MVAPVGEMAGDGGHQGAGHLVQPEGARSPSGNPTAIQHLKGEEQGLERNVGLAAWLSHPD
jgi:hypothetical protein